MDKTINSPVITVFMAVFNGEAHIKMAIESVLNQSFTDFELLIVNDGSTDCTLDIIRQFKDPRIRVVSNDGNKGLAFTRNHGLREARGQYIAILDSDDLSIPGRLEIQINFMTAYPEIALCGGQAITIDKDDNYTGSLNVPSSTTNMAHQLVLHNIFINSTLLIKKSVMLEVGGYRDLALAEDYDLSFRISLKHQVANLNQVLISYRIHENNISSLQAEKQSQAEINIIRDIQTHLNITTDNDLVMLHHHLMRFHLDTSSSQDFLHVLETLKHGNTATKIYDENKFNEMLFKKWFIVLREKKERKIISLYFKNQLFDWSFVTFKELRKVFKQAFFLCLPFRNN